MAASPNVIESEPWFCYGAHCDEIRALQRRLFIMSPLHSCWHYDQVRRGLAEWDSSTDHRAVFFLVKNKPVPADFMDGLKAMNVIIVEVALTSA